MRLWSRVQNSYGRRYFILEKFPKGGVSLNRTKVLTNSPCASVAAQRKGYSHGARGQPAAHHGPPFFRSTVRRERLAPTAASPSELPDVSAPGTKAADKTFSSISRGTSRSFWRGFAPQASKPPPDPAPRAPRIRSPPTLGVTLISRLRFLDPQKKEEGGAWATN